MMMQNAHCSQLSGTEVAFLWHSEYDHEIYQCTLNPS